MASGTPALETSFCSEEVISTISLLALVFTLKDRGMIPSRRKKTLLPLLRRAESFVLHGRRRGRVHSSR
jgi:hypothetical protein